MANTILGLYAEDILQLAADTTAATNARRFAQPEYWQAPGTDGIRIWGEFRTNPPLSVIADFTLLQSKAGGVQCSCKNPKPCEHAIALMLLWLENRDVFTRTEASSYAKEPSPRRAFTDTTTNPIQTIREGLSYLDQWLIRLIRQGLGEPHIRDYPFWDAMADRMLAAWMPGLSQWLRDIANIAVRGGDWVEPLLQELSSMYLLVRSFDRFKQLSAETQADIRETIGWRLNFNDFAFDTPTREQWLVLGHHQRTLRDQTPEQFLWLYGVQSQRMALIHSIGAKEIMQTSAFMAGQIADAALVYLPSRAPLKALLVRHYENIADPKVRGMSIPEAINGFGTALASNPWVKNYPVLLEEVYISRFDKGWIVCHADGTYLPIAPYFQHKWVLHALHGGYPVQVAGRWDGRVLFPMSAITHDGFVNLSQAMNYK